ncbi:MAG: chlorophyllase/cutinase-like alpha/beta fold protein [Bacteroidia bacterium]
MRKFFLLILSFYCLASQAQTYSIGHHEENPGYPGTTQTNPSVWTEVYYPANTAGDDVPVAAGKFPVVVFGHGFVMSWDSYSFFWEYLVPKGYICVFPRTHGSLSPTHADFAKDLAMLADYFPNVLNNTSSSAFFNHVAPASAIMGHSMGGGASFLAAANNTQIKTFVTWAAANTNPSALDSGAVITTPTLVLAGTEDCVAPVNDHQIPLYNSVASAVKHYVELTGASHCKFSNGNNFNCNFGEGTACIGWGPFLTTAEQQTRILALTDPWLRFYLKKDCAAWTAYTSALSSLDAAGFITQKTLQGDNTVVMPQISTQGNTLACNVSGASYQWLLNGNIIPNATQQNYVATTSGNYSIGVTYSNGCEQLSNVVNLTISGNVAATFTGKVAVSPNPATHVLHFSASQLQGNFLNLEILDVMGRSIWQERVRLQGTELEKEISVEHFGNAVYFLKVTNEEGLWLTQWLKI